MHLLSTVNVTFKTITVMNGGKLVCPQSSISIRMVGEKIFVNGSSSFTCGSPDTPFTGNLKIMLQGNEPLISATSSSVLSLHGKPVYSWTVLAETARLNASEIVVVGTQDELAGWVPGAEIVVAPTDFNFTEYEIFRIVQAIPDKNRLRLKLNGSLTSMHFGEYQNIGDRVLRSCGEVGLLSRNIKIYGDAHVFNTVGRGVSIIVEQQGSRMFVSNIEMRYAGWFDVLGRYAIHFHRLANPIAGQASYISSSSIMLSKNRCIVTHCSNGVTISKNVCVDHIGHGFMVEEIAEKNNIFSQNLGITTRFGTGNLIDSDAPTKEGGVATFWFRAARNRFIGNVAAGSESIGFAFDTSSSLNNPLCADATTRNNFRKQPLLEFSNNLAHSTHMNAFWFGINFEVPIAIPDLQAYKVSGHNANATTTKRRGTGACVWGFSSKAIRVYNSVLADCARATWSQAGLGMYGGAISMFSANVGNPGRHTNQMHAIYELEVNRSLPHAVATHQVLKTPNGVGAPINYGIAPYDWSLMTEKFYFVNYTNLYNRKGQLIWTTQAFQLQGGMMSPTKTFLSKIHFQNPNHATFTYVNRRFSGHMIDKDGSVTGKAGTIIVPPLLDGQAQDPLLPSLSCAWNNAHEVVYCTPSKQNIDIATVDMLFTDYSEEESKSFDIDVSLSSSPSKSRRLEGNNVLLNMGGTNGRGLFQYAAQASTHYVITSFRHNVQLKPIPCMRLRIYSAYFNSAFRFTVKNVKATTGVKFSLSPSSLDFSNEGTVVSTMNEINKAAGMNSPIVRYRVQNGDLHLAVHLKQPLENLVLFDKDGGVISQGGLGLQIC